MDTLPGFRRYPDGVYQADVFKTRCGYLPGLLVAAARSELAFSRKRGSEVDAGEGMLR
jgi:hypothetical protein